jgi:Barstar (barnase inhibitor)
VFDATAPDFAQQWQRLDWQLLQNSSIHRYPSDDEMVRTATGLAALGYTIHHLDAGNWRHADEMHTALAAELNFPSYYGRNLDALNDVFRDISEYCYGSDPSTTGTVLALSRYGSFTLHNSKLAHALVDIFARNARNGLLVGHPMLCLISAKNDFPDVGATPVELSLAPLEISRQPNTADESGQSIEGQDATRMFL